MADLFDRSLKVLARRAAPAFFRPAGLDVRPDQIRTTDVSINLPEHRADQVFLIGGHDDPDRWAMHLEFQLQPDPRVLPGWFLKNAALTVQLGLPVLLVVTYLTRSGRATFPGAYTAARGAVTNQFRFHTIYLWEHTNRIRGGELAELAPLLLLCEEEASEVTLHQERELILGLDTTPAMGADLLAVAAMVGSRYFARELIQAVVREELEMLKEGSFIQDWIEEALEKGRAEGRGEGEASGIAKGARQLLLDQLRARFGPLPEAVVERVERMEPADCHSVGVRLLTAGSLEELGLTVTPNSNATNGA